jgi:hypothetical protein
MEIEEILERLLTTQTKFLNSELIEEIDNSKWIYLKENKKQYFRFVRILTEVEYDKYRNEINPNNYERSWKSIIKIKQFDGTIIKKRKSKVYQLDHKYSVSSGFKNKVKPSIIASKYNLEMLTKKENKLKSGNCSILLEDLKLLNEKDLLTFSC